VTTTTARARLAELFAKVDAFFERVAARFPGDDGVTCRTGCDDCCRRRFSVTALEAEVIGEALAALPADRREALAHRAIEGDPDVCPALDDDGRCAVYAARPLICRTHGLPIRFAETSAPRVALPVLADPAIDACPRNFGGRDLAALPADCVLDQTTLSTIVGALDAARAAEVGRSRGERVDIAAVLAGDRAS
jgi:Fe-S-cluster containining protein